MLYPYLTVLNLSGRMQGPPGPPKTICPFKFVPPSTSWSKRAYSFRSARRDGTGRGKRPGQVPTLVLHGVELQRVI